jgi:hypothetical protein
MAKVQNMTSSRGNKVANQFIIYTESGSVFQSYNSIIAKITDSKKDDNYYASVELDKKYWNYSNTTGKYRNIFLNETIKDTKAKIRSGEYKLTDLNSKPVYEDTIETINLNK